MTTTVSLGDLIVGQPTVDANGVMWWHRGITGWRDGTPMQLNFVTNPLGPGSYDGPAYPAARVITLSGTFRAPSHAARLQAMRDLQGIMADGSLGPFMVTDELGSLYTQVRKSDKPTMVMAGLYDIDYTMQFTAPEPRLLDVRIQSVSTTMAQPGAGGVQWNGPGGNLVPNPGFEGGAGNWTAAGGALVQSATQANSGAYSGQSTPNGTSGTNSIKSDQFPAVAGLTYQFQCWLWFTAPVTTFQVIVTWYNSSHTQISTTGASGISYPAGAWSELVLLPVTAPATTAFAAITLEILGTPPVTQVWYADDVSFVRNSGVQWGGPAGTTGVSWGQSTSTGAVVLDNTDGTAAADIVITIQGPALTPFVVSGNNWITYNGNLTASDSLVINTGSGSVLLNGVNRRPYLTRADFFTIPPGEQVQILFGADIENATATMTAQWNVSYA